MVTKVLLGLIGIVTLHFWRIEQRQTHGVVVRFIPSIAGIVEDGNTILPRTVGKISPLVSINLKQVVAVIAALHVAKTDIVGCLRIADIQGELGFEQSIQRAPVNLVLKIDTLRFSTFVEVYALSDFRLAIFLFYNECLTQRSRLHADFHPIVYRHWSLIESSLLNLPSGPYLRQAIVEYYQSQTLV